MSTPQRIRLSRAKGFRLPEGTVNVARPSKWGNPFVVGKDGTRLQCVAMFYTLAGGFVDFGGRVTVDDQMKLWRALRRSIKDLEGKDLACWCPLDGSPCHADLLLFLANDGLPGPSWMKGEVELPRVRLGMQASDVERLNRNKRRKERQAGT